MERHHLEYSKTLMEDEVGFYVLILMFLPKNLLQMLFILYFDLMDLKSWVLSNLLLSLLFTESEYLPKPSEASV